jgi:hypothetical protein
MKVARLSVLRTGRLYPQETFLVLISVNRRSRPQGHSAAGRIMSMKNSNDTIGNRSHDFRFVAQCLNHTASYGAEAKRKDKGVTVHSTKANKGSRSIGYFNSFLASRLDEVGAQLHAPTALPSQKEAQSPINEVGRVPEAAGTFWKRQKSLAPTESRTSDRPTRA